MNTRWVFAGLLICSLATPGLAQEAFRVITVEGNSSVSVRAEHVELTLSVKNSGDSLAKAKVRNDQLTQQILDFAKQQANVIAVAQVLDAEISFQPPEEEHAYPDKGKQQSSLVLPSPNAPPGSKEGNPFGAATTGSPPIVLRREVSLRFTELEQVWKALAEFTSWDAVRKTREIDIRPLRYGVKNESAVRQQARRRAVASAEETAQVLAESAGLKLGSAIEIVDRSANGIRPYSPGRLDDPFGAGTLPAPDNAHFVALQEAVEEARVGKINDPPQITISGSVQIKYEVRIPQ